MADAERRIQELLFTYAARIDAGDLDGVAELFTHGRVHGMEDPPPEAVFEGRGGVRALYTGTVRLYPDGTPKTKHVTTNTRISVDEDAGRGESHAYYTVTQATDELPLQIIITGRYHDTFHVIDGDWWFDTRTMYVDQVGDLSHHLKYEI